MVDHITLTLQQVLDGLESNISDYERLTGREPAAQRLYSNTFSGYTVGLIDAVTRMTTYLKEVAFIFKSSHEEYINQKKCDLEI